MKRRLRISYRVSLVVAIPLIVGAVGLAIAWRGYTSTRRTVDALANDLFRNVSDQAAAQARSLLSRAAPVADMAQSVIGDETGARDLMAARRHLLALLRANGELAWVSYSDKSGAFYGIHRTPEGIERFNFSYIENGHTIMDEWNVDAEDKTSPYRHNSDFKYDPRTRPFYKAAAAAKRRIWTPPYVFFDEGLPGITCAAPKLDAKKEVAGVSTVDFDLNGLSRFVSTLRLSDHGRVFLLTDEGLVLAHPTHKLVVKSGGGAGGKLVTIADIDDAMLRDLWQSSRSRSGDRFAFDHGGEPWRGSFAVFEPDAGLRWVVAAAAPERDFLGDVRRQNLISLAVSLGAVVLAVILALLLASRVAGPLSEIAAQMDEVGRFDVEDKPPRATVFEEIAMMDDALRRMKQGLRSFGLFVPRDVVRAVLASGQEAVLAGETRDLTVFFSDLAGFTTIAESMDPDALVKLLGGYFDETTRIIADQKGTVDKFIGDGIMAFWGAPIEAADHAARACEAAVLCQRRIDQAKREGVPWAQHLKARIGIATGNVVVGNIGSPARLNYTVMGDTVNLAARLEGLGKAYGTRILVAESTYRAAGGRVIGRPVDVAAVKGKARGVKIYELICLAGDAEAESARALERVCEQALDAYLARDFAGAALRWQEALAMRAGDEAISVMIARAREFQASPPPEGWAGVHVVHEK